MDNNSSKVFVSYAHSTPEHDQLITNLVNALRKKGLIVTVDIDVKTPQGPEEGWPIWMKRQIKNADWVLIFFDKVYRRRFDGEEALNKGYGATWEGAIITHQLYRARRNEHFIPLLADNANVELIPDELIGANYYQIPKQIDELCTKLISAMDTGHSIFDFLIERKPKKTWETSVGLVLAVLVLAICLPMVIFGMSKLLRHHNTFTALRRTQLEVQRIEVEMNRSAVPSNTTILTGDREYHDPVNGEHKMTDTWSEGKLICRSFFAGGRLIARDSFQYDKGMVVGKVRVYMDSNRCVFLEDRFSQDGLLTIKRHCPEGLERPAEVYLDDMRSPLPPTQLIFYR